MRQGIGVDRRGELQVPPCVLNAGQLVGDEKDVRQRTDGGQRSLLFVK